jgi:hypothetical protein
VTFNALRNISLCLWRIGKIAAVALICSAGYFVRAYAETLGPKEGLDGSGCGFAF